jgi:hypothetical protein
LQATVTVGPDVFGFDTFVAGAVGFNKRPTISSRRAWSSVLAFAAAKPSEGFSAIDFSHDVEV